MKKLKRKIINKNVGEWDQSFAVICENETLTDYFAKTRFFNGLITPILFVDQFEELFTIAPKYGKPDEITQFAREIAQLMGAYEGPKSDATVQCKVVFSFRQDFLGQFEDLKFFIPSITQNRYQLKKFTYIQAHQAITGPWQKEVTEDANILFSKERISNIIEEIGEKVFVTPTESRKVDSENNKPVELPNEERLMRLQIDPTILSLYCYQLYKDNLKSKEKKKYFSFLSEKPPSINDLIDRYYNNAVSQGKIRRAIENRLITADGRRLVIDLKQFIENRPIAEPDEKSDNKNGTLIAAFKKIRDFFIAPPLSEKHILAIKEETALFRISGEQKKQIEIAHDRVAKRVLASKKKREAAAITAYAAIGLIFILSTASIISYLFTTEAQQAKNAAVQAQNRAAAERLYAQQLFQVARKDTSLQILKIEKDSIASSLEGFIRNKDSVLQQKIQKIGQLEFDINSLVSKIGLANSQFNTISMEWESTKNQLSKEVAERNNWKRRSDSLENALMLCREKTNKRENQQQSNDQSQQQKPNDQRQQQQQQQQQRPRTKPRSKK
jgi:hypothetical protein